MSESDFVVMEWCAPVPNVVAIEEDRAFSVLSVFLSLVQTLSELGYFGFVLMKPCFGLRPVVNPGNVANPR